MAKFQYEVPDDKLEFLAAAVCRVDGYEETIDQVSLDENGIPKHEKKPNPQSPLEFVVSRVEAFLNGRQEAYKNILLDEQIKAAAEKADAISPVKLTVL